MFNIILEPAIYLKLIDNSNNTATNTTQKNNLLSLILTTVCFLELL